MSQNFIKGAMILSLSLFLTKILGIVYTIPFKALVGETRPNTLWLCLHFIQSIYQFIYTWNPVGMAKFVSKYQASGEYDTARKTFRLCPCYDCFRVYRIFNDVFLCPYLRELHFN